ncbi:MAG: DNA replication/repair protein RecF [Myxococcaceae bacterium]|nr:DNA replication/repair protein RecF [Myxococcaceae bacterium]
MKLLSLTCERFRNLGAVTLDASAGTTVAVGENGQGKTNLLEALYFLATLKPLRASKLVELVQWGQTQARVSARFVLGGAERELSVVVGDGTRTALVDGKKASSFEGYFGGVSVVAFTPDDLQVVKGGPDGRRAFLDRAVFNRAPAYLQESRDYARALKSRNRLLKSQAPAAHLAPWDDTLARLGARVWARRRALLLEVGPRTSEAFERISRSGLEAHVWSAPSGLDLLEFRAKSEDELQQHLLRALDERRGRDLERGFTSSGPHTDDLTLELDGRPAKAFASQGQARALVLAWKVAEIENLQAASGVLPLLLLDDVSSELDPERNAFLMGYLKASGAQVVLTTTDERLVRDAAGTQARWYRVRGGTAEPYSSP